MTEFQASCMRGALLFPVNYQPTTTLLLRVLSYCVFDNLDLRSPFSICGPPGIFSGRSDSGFCPALAFSSRLVDRPTTNPAPSSLPKSMHRGKYVHFLYLFHPLKQNKFPRFGISYN